jgi:hypothetical protein
MNAATQKALENYLAAATTRWEVTPDPRNLK